MIRLGIEKNILIVSVFGELDLVMAKEFNTKVDEMLLAHVEVKELIIDLNGVSFVDSTGLGAIIGRYKVMKLRGGKVSVLGANKSVKKVLEMAGLKKIVGIVG